MPGRRLSSATNAASGSGSEAMGNSRYLHTELGQALAQVMTGGVAFDIRAERDDHLVRRPAGQALLELSHPQLLRANAVHRRNLAAKHVVMTSERTGLFDIQNIDRTLDDADGSLVTRRVGANAARRFLGQAAALRALDDCVA